MRIRRILIGFIVHLLPSLLFVNSTYGSSQDLVGREAFFKHAVGDNDGVASHTYDNPFGEIYDPFSGELFFAQTDIDLPGNSHLPVRLTRIRKPILWGYNGPDYYSGISMENHLFGDWRLDIPSIPEFYLEPNHESIHSTYCNNRESAVEEELSWAHYASVPRLQVNGKTRYLRFSNNSLLEEGMYPTQPGGFNSNNRLTDFVTDDHWVATCGVNQDGRFNLTVKSPIGDTYYFDSNTTFPNGLYATRVVDRYGNWVKYENIYGAEGRIYSNDGREIKIFRDPDSHEIVRAEAGSRVWHYTYDRRENAKNDRDSKDYLQSVERPDGKRYYFLYAGYENLDPANYFFNNDLNPARVNLRGEIGKALRLVFIHPDGAVGDYLLEVDGICLGKHMLMGAPDSNLCWEGLDEYKAHAQISAILDSKSLKYDLENKYEWEYNYLGQAFFTDRLFEGEMEKLYTDPFVHYGISIGGHDFNTRVTEIISDNKRELYTYADGFFSNFNNDDSGFHYTIKSLSSFTYRLGRRYQYGDLVSYEVFDKGQTTPILKKEFEYEHFLNQNRACEVTELGTILWDPVTFNYNNIEIKGKLHCKQESSTAGYPTSESDYYKYRNSPDSNVWINDFQEGKEVDVYNDGTVDYIVPGVSIPVFLAHLKRYKTSEKTIQDGSEYLVEILERNKYGEVTKIKESNNFSNNVKYTQYTFQHEINRRLLDQYILNLPVKTMVSTDNENWYVTEERAYESGNEDWNEDEIFLKSIKKNGQIYLDNIKRSIDRKIISMRFYGKDEYTQFYADYKAGIPQREEFYDRYDINLPKTSISRSVDDFGNIIYINDLNGNETFYEYDNFDRLVLIDPVDPKWENTSIQYADSDLLFSDISGLKVILTRGDYQKATYFDYLNREVVSLEQDVTLSGNENDRYIRKIYNSDNQPVYISHPSNQLSNAAGIRTSYDAAGRVVSISESSTDYEQYYEYLSGNKQRHTDFKGNKTLKTFLAYGQPKYELPVKIESPESVITDIKYDIHDNIVTVKQGGFTSDYVYDSNLQLCKISRPEKGWTYLSHQHGLLDWSAHGISLQATTLEAGCDYSIVGSDMRNEYFYDNQRLLRSINLNDTTSDLLYEYDQVGNLLGTSFGESDWRYTYNSLDKVETQTLSIRGKNFVLDPEYNSLGYVTSMSYPSGRYVSLSSNALGDTTSISGIVDNAQYYPSGTVKTIEYANGTSYEITQNHRKLPQNVYLTDGQGSLLADLIYGYDKNSNIDWIQNGLNSAYDIDLGYDGLNRLISADGSWGTGSIVYDTANNITTKTLGEYSLFYWYDGNNLLESVTGSKNYSFSYDSRGNVTDNGNRDFNFNALNQMISSSGIAYVYDGHNRRVIKQKSDGAEYSVYGLDSKLYYRMKANGDHIDYLYLNGNVVAIIESQD